MYKVLILDIDGTLTNSKSEITPTTKEVLIETQKAGIKIVLASGRPVFGVVPYAKELELEKYGGFILAFNGGKIANVRTGEVVYDLKLPNELIPRIYQSAKENELTIISYDNTQVITENPDDDYVKKQKILKLCTIKKVDNFPSSLPRTINKCMICGPPATIEQQEKRMQAEFGGLLGIFRSDPCFLEVVPRGVDKAASLARLAQHLGVSSCEMMACGDGYNDVSMLAYAGLGVAMANAQDAVKEVADFVTLSNDEDGVAYAVQKYIMKKKQ